MDSALVFYACNSRGAPLPSNRHTCCGPGRGAYGLRRESDATHGEGGTTELPGHSSLCHHEPHSPMTLSGSSRLEGASQSRKSVGAAGGTVTPPTAIRASPRRLHEPLAKRSRRPAFGAGTPDDADVRAGLPASFGVTAAELDVPRGGGPVRTGRPRTRSNPPHRRCSPLRLHRRPVRGAPPTAAAAVGAGIWNCASASASSSASRFTSTSAWAS